MRRLLLIEAVIIAGVLLVSQQGHAAPPGCSRPCIERIKHRELRLIERARVKACRGGDVVACIRHAAHVYRQDPVAAIRVARCESGLDPSETYIGHLGLYQFLASTWASTPYAGKDVFSAHWASLGAMWMWSVGRRGEWACG